MTTFDVLLLNRNYCIIYTYCVILIRTASCIP